jgi:hypothetical protein
VAETLAAALEAAGLREGQLRQQFENLKAELAATAAAADDAAATRADEHAELTAREARVEGRLQTAEARVAELSRRARVRARRGSDGCRREGERGNRPRGGAATDGGG